MPDSSSPAPRLEDSYVLVVDQEATCVVHPRVPEVVGKKPWDYSHPDDRAQLRERFVRACMFREEVTGFETRVQCGPEILHVEMSLYPLDTGQVLVTYHRQLDETLSPRERAVLGLLAEGAGPVDTATALGIRESTVRDHVASIKKKLRLDSKEELTLAARRILTSADARVRAAEAGLSASGQRC